MSAIGRGGGFKNWSKLPTDSIKKLPTLGRGVSKIRKICRRRLWMVPNKFSIEIKIFYLSLKKYFGLILNCGSLIHTYHGPVWRNKIELWYSCQFTFPLISLCESTLKKKSSGLSGFSGHSCQYKFPFISLCGSTLKKIVWSVRIFRYRTTIPRTARIS